MIPELLLEMGYFLGETIPNTTTTDGWADGTLSQNWAIHLLLVMWHVWPLSFTLHQSWLPCLPALLTTQQLSGETCHPTSLPNRSVIQGGRKA